MTESGHPSYDPAPFGMSAQRGRVPLHEASGVTNETARVHHPYRHYRGGVAHSNARATEKRSIRFVPRIGYLAPSLSPEASRLIEAFRQGLHDIGYVEGQNIVLELRSAEGRPDRFPALAAELVALKVDVIVAGATPTVLVLKQATRTIPIVFPIHTDPVGAGIVATLARPGGNATGLSYFSQDLIGKRLQLLKEVVPGMSRIAVLWISPNAAALVQLKTVDAAVRALEFSVKSWNHEVPRVLRVHSRLQRRGPPTHCWSSTTLSPSFYVNEL